MCSKSLNSAPHSSTDSDFLFDFELSHGPSEMYIVQTYIVDSHSGPYSRILRPQTIQLPALFFYGIHSLTLLLSQWWSYLKSRSMLKAMLGVKAIIFPWLNSVITYRSLSPKVHTCKNRCEIWFVLFLEIRTGILNRVTSKN